MAAYRCGVQWQFQRPCYELLGLTSGLKMVGEIDKPGERSAAVIVSRWDSMLDQAI